MQDQAEQIKEIINSAQKIVIIQADNPDADSLGSALALEQILENLGKSTYLYCGVDMPGYLRYMKGWDRVNKDLASSFDASIIVDASTMTLLEKLRDSGEISWLAAKPSIVLDHHEVVEHKIDFASSMINDGQMSSAGELIYHLSKQLDWPLNLEAMGFIMSSILGDTQGLTNQLASARTYKVMAEMIEAGVSRPALEEQRRELSKMPVEIYKYKADLIKRTEFDESGRVAVVVVPDSEIKTYSPLYNPAPLIQTDMLQVQAVEVAVVLKSYDNGKVTGAIRSNPGSPIAAKLADHYGGGGHANASGFKIESGADISNINSEIKDIAVNMLNELNHEAS